MAEPTTLDKTYHIIMKSLVETGKAPFFNEVAEALGVSMEEGRKAVQSLFAEILPGWVFPKTDIIVSLAPFNNLPNQYPITVDGDQKWFGQWAFESLAVSWLFPGKTVRIDTICMHCGVPIRVEMRDGEILDIDPEEGLVGYVAVPFSKWYDDISYAWSTMNFFRSEEHVRDWVNFNPATENGIISIANLHRLFSCEHMRRRLDPDFVSRRPILRQELLDLIKALNLGPFWEIP